MFSGVLSIVVASCLIRCVVSSPQTRADASKRSIIRAKELNIERIHPLFTSQIGSKEKELEE